MARPETQHTKFPAAPRPAGAAVRVGFVPLIDAAPLIVARELGLFEAHGLRVTLERQIGWGNVRDKLSYGHLDAAHALIGMPLSSVLAADWSGERLVSVMELGAGGNAITLGKAMVDRGVRSAASLAKWVADHKLNPVRRGGPGSAIVADDADPEDGKPVLAHVFGCSMHHYLLRDWLASAGIDPDLDVRLCVLPPEQMPTHLRNGHLDGFCVGEPWNTTAQRGGDGTVVAPTTDLLPDHPEKVLAVSRRWAADNGPTVVAMIKALLSACAWCADDVNHPDLARMLSADRYLGLPAEAVMASLRLDRSIGVSPNQSSPRPEGWRMRSFAVDRTFPSGTHAAWLAEQMIRWGHADADADVLAAARRCTDASFYRQAAAETDVACPADDFPTMPLRHHGCYDARRSPYRGPPQHPRRPRARLGPVRVGVVAQLLGTRNTSCPVPARAHSVGVMRMSKIVNPFAPATPTGTTRRGFLKTAVGGAALAAAAGLPLGGLMSGCQKKAPGATKTIKVGIIALTDCSPIVIAHEKGFFKKHGVDVVVDKKANWRSIYDSLTSGDIQATHMLIGMPIASTLGMIGPKVPMVIPWILNRNGQSISLAKELKGKVQDSAAPLKPIVDAAKAGGKPMSFAMTFPPGTHAMWIRYWLAAGGINPDRDIDLSVVPPASMFANIQAGNMTGSCVGEPWNGKMVDEKVGFTAVNTQDLWADHPEKVMAFREDFAAQNPDVVKGCLKALHEASVWLDDMKNRPEQCSIISATNYVNCPPASILPRMQGVYDFGGRTKTYDKHYMIFSERNCNYPQEKYAVWFMTQFRRWGLLQSPPDYAAVAKQVMRGDLYEAAMKELGYAHGGANNEPEKLVDSVFDPKDPEGYAKSFAVHSMKA